MARTNVRGQQKLTPHQEETLAYARKADDHWREAKLNARVQIRRQVEEQIALHASTRDRAVWEAVEAGVPKARISTDALRTSPNAVYEILDRVMENLTVSGVGLATKDVPLYSWTLHEIDGSPYAYLHIDGDDHISTGMDGDDYEWTRGEGYLFWRDIYDGWKAQIADPPPAEAIAWAKENPPA